MAEQPADVEYERRFLVSDPTIIEDTDYVWIDQAYLWTKSGYAIRVRLVNDDPQSPQSLSRNSTKDGILTLKGPRHDATRYELEQHIPRQVALDLINLSAFRINKHRHMVVGPHDVWSVDVFLEENEGLIIAEFEGSHQAVANLVKPSWCGEEVTEDHKYDNENLAKRPFRTWLTE